MKKTIKSMGSIVAALAISLSLILVSCKKEAGPKGDTGPAGPAGAAGTNGSSNISTFVGTTTNSSWTLNGSEYDATLSVSGITSAVVSNGSIMVFIGNTAQTEWSALPFSYQNVEFNYSYSLGQVLLQVTLGNGSTPSNPGGIPFKVVVIPPGMVKPNVNVTNYKEIKAAYNLQD